MTRSVTNLTELAAETGIARPTLSRWTNRHSDAEDENLERVAAVLGESLPPATGGSHRVTADSDAAHLGDGETGREIGDGDDEMMSPMQHAGAASQLPAADILQLLQHDRPGFVRYLQRTWADPLVPSAARLQFLDFVEEIARERGIPVPKAYLDHLRGLIAERGL